MLTIVMMGWKCGLNLLCVQATGAQGFLHQLVTIQMILGYYC